TAVVLGGVISGDGHLAVQSGNLDMLTLTGNAIHTGGTTVTNAWLAIGNGGTTGWIAGDVATASDGVLEFNRSDHVTFGGRISGSGALQQSGAGTLELTGSNSYTGLTQVLGGTLLINGDQSAATGVAYVYPGATLGGSGIIGGGVSVHNNAVLAPGSNGPGTLTIGGNLQLNADSVLDFEFGAANVADGGGPLNDLIVVGGNVQLNGRLAVSVAQGGSFDPGIFRLINYYGTRT